MHKTVYRVFVEKKAEFAQEANFLAADIRDVLGISRLSSVRVINRYDVELEDEALFTHAVSTVFSEPQVDTVTYELDARGGTVFAVEYLPGQFDQRADSAAQCIQIMSQAERPIVRSAKVYVLEGDMTARDIDAIKKHIINPVEAREARLEKPQTLEDTYDEPADVSYIDGFCELKDSAAHDFIADYGLAMDTSDLLYLRDYFRSEGREPTITEIRVIDTYWSDHCRHTTFMTEIDSVTFADSLLESAYADYLATREALGRTKPVSLMDIATIAVKHLRANGKLDGLDESEEINACTVKIDVNVDGKTEPWLLLFKNETHNHPTEIEPFGGAATCVGGAIRDPLSGRSYVYGAMRLSGAADPLTPADQTLPGRLSQRAIVTGAAHGYSSYGNQIGLATGIVDEIYHPGYAAKHMEVGAVIAAAPQENVRRERPEEGDAIILLGGATGRDGIGGATGSSKAHDDNSVDECGAEVQKGNAPEERKLQRLFRNSEASRLIKRCNDFGAGGVSVAIGELADGLHINLDAVPKKYEGLDGTELAISESQERMAVVVEAGDVQRFIDIAETENVSAVEVARVTEEPRLVMEWRGARIVDISREFLDTNGAPKHTTATPAPATYIPPAPPVDFAEGYRALVRDLNVCSKRGLSERFDSTIGAGTVLMPFGGERQLTPIQAMVHKVSLEQGDTDTCSLMSWGYNPFISAQSPYHGAYLAVVESMAKLVATGGYGEATYLSFQEYFEKLGTDPVRWGKPLAAVLGGFKAQMDLGVGAIGGKDSMSGSFNDLDVPPTLISFAVTTSTAERVISPEFKQAGSRVVVLTPDYDETGLPNPESVKVIFAYVGDLMSRGHVRAAYTPTIGGIAEAVFKMCLGNSYGFTYADGWELSELFGYSYGSFVLELTDDAGLPEGARPLGEVSVQAEIARESACLPIDDLFASYEGMLENIYRCNITGDTEPIENFTYTANSWGTPVVQTARPRFLVPVFPGTNCEYDTAKAIEAAGGQADIFIVRNRSVEDISLSVSEFAEHIHDAQALFIPGGFSSGDEPDGSGKFITAFFRNEAIADAVEDLLDVRGGLMAGICNGFQALVKLGLLPYGKILTPRDNFPTLTFNTIARHQSKIVRTRITSNKSPWLAGVNPGEVYSVPISHGEGRFVASDNEIRALVDNGQIATQYVDMNGDATSDIRFNPNGSLYAIEGITSPDGRVLGKMGHSERIGLGLYKNVPGDFDIHMFESAVRYFQA